MAERYAVQSGPWSDTSTWDGGTLPSPGDTVHAGGFDVVIDQSVEVGALSLAAGDSAPAGGRFIVNNTVSAPVTIHLSVGILAGHHQSGNASSNARTFVLWVLDGSPEVTLSAPEVRGGNGSYRSAVGVCVTGTATDGSGSANVVINSDLYGGGSSGTYAVRFDGAGELSVTGDVTGGGGSNAYGVNVTGGAVDITGDITGGSGSNAHGVNVTGGAVDITGDVTGGGSSAHGVQVASGTVTVTGDVTGGGGSSAYGVQVASGAVEVNIEGIITGAEANGIYCTGSTSTPVTITGAIHGGPKSAHTSGIHVNNTNILLRINGGIHASEHNPALTGIDTTQPIAIKSMHNHQNGRAATTIPKWVIWDADNFQLHAYTDLNWPEVTGEIAIIERFPTGAPDASDVREGVPYGPGGSLTGTLRVPTPFTLADIAAVTGAQIAAATNTD